MVIQAEISLVLESLMELVRFTTKIQYSFLFKGTVGLPLPT